jgi:hypothetical protein
VTLYVSLIFGELAVKTLAGIFCAIIQCVKLVVSTRQRSQRISAASQLLHNRVHIVCVDHFLKHVRIDERVPTGQHGERVRRPVEVGDGDMGALSVKCATWLFNCE